MRAVGIFGAALLCATGAAAGELKLKPIDAGAAFASSFKSISGQGISPLNKDCVEKARAVCTYKLGEFGVLIAAGPKKTAPSEEVTLICSAGESTQIVSCVNSYLAIIKITAPDMSKDGRGSIVSAMLKVLEVSDETRIKTEGVEFILQKLPSAGLWFHAKALD